LLKRIIADFHQRPFPAYTPRDLAIPADLEKIITIIGPRRAGKTYYLFQIMDEQQRRGLQRHQILYLNFEDERLELEGQHDLILEAYWELYPDLDMAETFFFFDEIQGLDKWEQFIRRMYDTVTRRIFITGSNSRFLSAEIATSLRGRSLAYEIMPLSFREYLRFREIDHQDIHSTRNTARISHAFEEYLVWGGYPELVHVEPSLKTEILHEYFNVMIWRDLVERYDIRNVSVLKYLLKRMISGFTKEFSVNKLYNELKSRGRAISKQHIYDMTDAILSVYMLGQVEKYEPSVIRREMSNKKIYLYDNGFASVTQYTFFEDRGKLLENMVFTHLRRQSDQIFFAKNAWECDFAVFFKRQPPLFIQVSHRLSSDNIRRETKGFESALKMAREGKCLLLFEEMEAGVRLPEGIEAAYVKDWLLGSETGPDVKYGKKAGAKR
ncbi:ATP-binding protein, partial [Desulfococcaceae bacterium HSG8]|nr:ATP-binding protein [Desulfococcaceae bacterium HSG8]